MLQLKVPFSNSETQVLMRCLSQLESRNAVNGNPSAADKNSALYASVKRKVNSNIYDDFYHDEITHMIFALDKLARECSNQLNENTPKDTALELSGTLRVAASARSKLRRATNSD